MRCARFLSRVRPQMSAWFRSRHPSAQRLVAGAGAWANQQVTGLTNPGGFSTSTEQSTWCRTASAVVLARLHEQRHGRPRREQEQRHR
jgi:hypothetical protein